MLRCGGARTTRRFSSAAFRLGGASASRPSLARRGDGVSLSRPHVRSLRSDTPSTGFPETVMDGSGRQQQQQPKARHQIIQELLTTHKEALLRLRDR